MISFTEFSAAIPFTLSGSCNDSDSNEGSIPDLEEPEISGPRTAPTQVLGERHSSNHQGPFLFFPQIRTAHVQNGCPGMEPVAKWPTGLLATGSI